MNSSIVSKPRATSPSFPVKCSSTSRRYQHKNSYSLNLRSIYIITNRKSQEIEFTKWIEEDNIPFLSGRTREMIRAP
jgi:hypothetical protein